jgi:Na+-driven multidrug efflux pump
VTESLLKFSLFATFLGAVVNIGLNLILIPRYQGVGSAVATLISGFVSAYLSSFFMPAMVKIGWMQTKSFAAPLRFLFRSFRVWSG